MKLARMFVPLILIAAPLTSHADLRQDLLGTWQLTQQYCASSVDSPDVSPVNPEFLPRPDSGSLQVRRNDLTLTLRFFGCRFTLDSPYTLSGNVLSWTNGNARNHCTGGTQYVKPEPLRAQVNGTTAVFETVRASSEGGFCAAGQRAIFHFRRG